MKFSVRNSAEFKLNDITPDATSIEIGPTTSTEGSVLNRLILVENPYIMHYAANLYCYAILFSLRIAENCIRTFMNQCAYIQRNTAVIADAAIRVEEIHNEVLILSIFAYQTSRHQFPH